LGQGKTSGFGVVCLTAQFFFGGWFLAHGLNHWLEFFPRPSGSSSAARDLIGALNQSGIFIAVKALEVVTGALLLANRAVPLAAVLAMPITLSIAMLNILGNMDTFSLFVGVIAIALNALILLGHLDAFLPMLAWRHGDPSSAGLARLAAEGFPASAEGPSLRGFGHLLAIAAGIAAPVLVTFWSVSDSGFRSKDHYRQVAGARP
jgi:DoxX